MSRRKRLAAGLAVAMCVGGVVAGYYFTRPTPRPVPEIPLGNAEGATVEAVREAQAAVRANPRSGPAWGRLAMVLHANGFTEHISECYAEATRLDPKNRSWPYLHGLFLLEVNPREGLRLLEDALALATQRHERAAITYRLCLGLIEAGRLDEAQRHLATLKDLEPEATRVHLGRGLLAKARGEPERARAEFRSVAADPDYGRQATYLLAGLVDPVEARQLIEQANRRPTGPEWPHDPIREMMRTHYVNRQDKVAPVMELNAQGRSAEALTLLRSIVATDPDREVWYLFGVQLLNHREYEEAEGAFRTAIRLEPTNVTAHLLLAECLFQRGKRASRKAGGEPVGTEMYRESLRSADDALALQPEMAAAHFARGRSLKALDRPAEAIKAFRRAVVIQPDSADMHLRLGVALAESGDTKEGLRHLQFAEQFAPPGDPKPGEALREWRAKTKLPATPK